MNDSQNSAKLNETLENVSLNESYKSEDVENSSFVQEKGTEPRKLTEEEIKKLEKDTKLVNEFKQKKFELEAKKNWDLFYRRNKTNFFKDRYWTFREFEELNNDEKANTENNELASNEKKVLLEIGCGVGNFMYPLLKQNKNIFIFACDFSSDAIDLLKSNPDYDTNRCMGFVCDVTKPNLLRDSLPPNTQVDIVTLIFVLSAIHPSKMQTAIDNIAQIVRPNGVVLVRDYGMNDHSMIRFDPGHKLDEKFYVRQDGTRTFFFSLEEIDNLFLTPRSTPIVEKSNQTDETSTTSDGDTKQDVINGTLFKKQANEYVFRETVNIKENLRVPRVFIQSKFIRTDFNI